MKNVLGDEVILQCVVAGEAELFELLVRRHSQRLFRVVRSLLRGDSDAEDALQQACIDAWKHLSSFDGHTKFSTWITRIALRAATAVFRRRASLDALASARTPESREAPAFESPDGICVRYEIARLLEQSINDLLRL